MSPHQEGKVSKNMRERLVTVTTELSPELAEEFYEVVNKKFEGNVDEAVSEAIRLLLISRKKRGLPY